MENASLLKLENYFSQFNTLNLPKNQTMLRPDDTPMGIYYLQQGYVRMYSISINGQEQTLNIFKPGSYFPVMWAIGKIRNNYFYQTLTPVTVRCAPKEEFLTFIKQEPEVLFELTQRILVGLDGILTMMETLLYGTASSKVATVILLCARRFGQKNENDEILIDLPLTHHNLASLAGLTRETTSLEIKKLEKKGMIGHLKRKIILKKPEEIEKELFILKEEISSTNTL